MRRLLTLVAATFVGCSPSPTRLGERFDGREQMFGTISGASRLTLYEGLPSHWGEHNAQESERATKPTVELHGYPFYRDPVPVRDGAGDRLRAVLAQPSSIKERKPNTIKACGGFHPDWCVEWEAGGAVYQCLVCFTCHEAKLYGPDRSLYCDLPSEAIDELKAILAPHRTNRPLNGKE